MIVSLSTERSRRRSERPEQLDVGKGQHSTANCWDYTVGSGESSRIGRRAEFRTGEPKNEVICEHRCSGEQVRVETKDLDLMSRTMAHARQAG